MNKVKYTKPAFCGNSCLPILLLLLFFFPAWGNAQQTYPVQVYTQLAPPYTPHIPAYYTGTQPKLKVMLINTDMQQPSVRVYLRMKILSSSFSLVNPPEVYTPLLELQAGVSLSLSLNDLEPYFKRENLRVSGGQSEFFRTQMLPDNFYRFYFEVYEANTNKLVSNPRTGFAQAMIAAGEPPIPNLPLKGAAIVESNIPAIMFSWTPRHMNSLAAAYGTEYEIVLVEIYDKRVAPEAAFDYSRVLYTETTKSTSFIHTAAQPLLIPGMRYAWRVQAKAREGIDEISVFKNNGFSPVSWFDYMADCKSVQYCGAIYENARVDISWQETGAMEYSVEYRKKGTAKWYTAVINKPLLSQIYGLQADTDYEYRIGARCAPGDAFLYNNTQAFRIPGRQQNSPDCGLMPDVNLANRTPASELQPGMPVLVGDFPVFITKVSGNGRFSGEGYVGIPYLQGAQIAVTFKDIIVNTDNRLIEGFFETKYDAHNNLIFDGDQFLTGGKGVGDIRTGEEKARYIVDYTIDSNIKALPVKPDGTKDEIAEGKDYTIAKGENGKYTFILTDSEGNEHKVEADTMPATITDKDGNTFQVNENGEVKPVSKDSDVKLDSSTRDTQSKLAALSFKATANTKYALDEYRSIYEKVTEYNDQYKTEGTAITASAKFMLPGASDEIAVYIKENKDNKLIPEKVRFITGKGKEYLSKYDSTQKQWLVTVVAGEVNDGQELYAVQEVGKDKYETLGKLNIFTYAPLERKVTLVSVNGATNGLDRQSVENGLNRIFGKVGISWTVNVLDTLSYTPKNGSTFNVTGSGLLSMFTDDMKAINEAFKQSGKYQQDGLYLFILPHEPSDKGEVSFMSGDMPLGSQFGYLFKGATIRTIAHEAGHGAFNLEHPFDRPLRNSFAQGDLDDNLMDYSSGTELAKLQWDQTRAPGHVIGLFQTDKSGMMNVPKGIHVKEKAQYAMPGARIIELEDITILPFCSASGYQGNLHSFIDNKGITWIPDNTTSYAGGYYFSDYVNTKDGTRLSKPTRIVRDNDIVYRVNFHAEKQLLKVDRITFGALGLSAVQAGDVFSIFERVKDYKIESLYEKTVQNPCEDTFPKDLLLSNLKILSNHSRADQSVELEYYDNALRKFRYFNLKDGQLAEVEKPLSDAEIESGSWTGGQETKIRYTVNEKGIIQVKAFGFRKDIKLADGKTVNLPELANNIKKQTNKFLTENRVISFNQQAPVFKDDGEIFADGKKIEIGNGNSTFFKIIHEGIGLIATLLKTARIEQDVYLNAPQSGGIIRAPGIATGTVEAATKTVTDITQLGCLVYDLVVDKQARTDVYNGLVQIKNEVKENPSQLFSILGEIILEEATGNTSEEWAEINNDQTDNGRTGHLITKGAVRTTVVVVASGKFVAQLPKMADDVAKKMGNVTRSVTEIKTLLLNSGEEFSILANARRLPGAAKGTGKEITGKWLRGTDGNAGLFPKSVADKLRGRTFNNFDEFRQAFWKEVANDPHLAKQFEPQQVSRMKNGLAPYAKEVQQLGGQRNYILHHRTPINQGGGVYDVDNLYIVAPKYHKEILAPAYHYGYGY